MKNKGTIKNQCISKNFLDEETTSKTQKHCQQKKKIKEDKNFSPQAKSLVQTDTQINKT